MLFLGVLRTLLNRSAKESVRFFQSWHFNFFVHKLDWIWQFQKTDPVKIVIKKWIRIRLSDQIIYFFMIIHYIWFFKKLKMSWGGRGLNLINTILSRPCWLPLRAGIRNHCPKLIVFILTRNIRWKSGTLNVKEVLVHII